MSKTLIFVSNGVEEVEALMVVDMLRRADIEIKMVSIEDGLMIESSHGVKFQADCMYEDVDFDSCDMIILPGGLKGTENLKNHADLNKQIKSFYEEGKMLAAICAAPTVFAVDGILKDKCATSYPGKAGEMIPEVKIYKEDKVVVDGNVITSRGLGTAIEFASAIITRFKGEEEAQRIKDMIVYDK